MGHLLSVSGWPSGLHVPSIPHAWMTAPDGDGENFASNSETTAGRVFFPNRPFVTN